MRQVLRACRKRYPQDPYLGTEVRVMWIYHLSLVSGVSRKKELYVQTQEIELFFNTDKVVSYQDRPLAHGLVPKSVS